MKFRQSMQWVCVAGVALLAAACGGGGGGDAPAPDMSTANRIEPFDPTLGKALKAAPRCRVRPGLHQRLRRCGWGRWRPQRCHP